MLVGRDEKVPNNYLFELKWLKTKDKHERVTKEAIEQVEGYLKLDNLSSTAKESKKEVTL